MRMEMFEIRNLYKRFGKVEAIRDVCLKVNDGELLGLVGPNGSGKTTTIRCALTLLEWDNGRIWINGHDIVDKPVEARKGLGYIPDSPVMYHNLTVWQHIAFIARAHRTENWEPMANEYLDKFELTKKKNELVSTLSKGQSQKLWCTCVFVTIPTVVFMDEPIHGMDPRGVHILKEMIMEMKKRGGCGLISSHQLPLVEELCDRIALISNGRILIEGPIKELKERVRLASDSDLEDLYIRVTDLYKAKAK
jgi:ABC-type multidrug transport system ATPase subunit